MKLGVYLDMRNPAPWPARWADLYSTTLETVAEAEQRGIDAVWLTEHHGFEDGYLSQPLAFAAAIAAHTSRIRIGTAVVLAPLRHAAHIAEEAALVDVLSGGRLELGLGAGYVRTEFDLFGADETRRYQATADTVRRLRDVFAGDALRPRPVQREIPIWLGYQGPRGARTAGALGTGLLSLDDALYAHYQQGRADAGLEGPGRIGGVVNLILARDPERTLEALLPHLAYHLNSYRQAIAAGRATAAPRILDVEELRREHERTGSVRGYQVLDGPQAVARLRAIAGARPVEHVFFWLRIGGMPPPLVAEHLDVLLDEVSPALARPAPPTPASAPR